MPSFTRLSQPLRLAARANLGPGLLLQTFAVLLLVGYYWVPALRSTFDVVGVWKQRGGYSFSVVSTALFGGVLPFLVMRATGLIPRRRALRELAFYVAFWSWKGLEVDALYRAQALWFGDSNSLGTIAAKVCADQFVFTLVWAAPTQTLCFLWKDSEFSLAQVRTRLAEQSFVSRNALVVISTWVVWLPAVTVIYALPQALQIPLFNLVLCFWCLLLSYLSRQQATEVAAPP